uniref:Uncharacterized protein n=1 Tax=Leptobrachium leishanense TaxID=445787 RepID=A0A8C5MIR5_9ANUR
MRVIVQVCLVRIRVRMGHIISVFVRELPVWYIFGGIFLPFALFLLGIMRFLWIELQEGDVSQSCTAIKPTEMGTVYEHIRAAQQ